MPLQLDNIHPCCYQRHPSASRSSEGGQPPKSCRGRVSQSCGCRITLTYCKWGIDNAAQTAVSSRYENTYHHPKCAGKSQFHLLRISDNMDTAHTRMNLLQHPPNRKSVRHLKMTVATNPRVKNPAPRRTESKARRRRRRKPGYVLAISLLRADAFSTLP